MRLVGPIAIACYVLMAASFSPTCQATDAAGALSNPTVKVASSVANPPRLANISTRLPTLTDDKVMIAGFIIGGTSSKTVVVRGRGPSLAAFGIADTLADPHLQLVQSSTGATVATNDNWQTGANASQVSASGFAPSDPRESAIHVTLAPGAYTAIVSGKSGATGVTLVEVFEVDLPETPLINISTRGFVQTGDNVMIGGFIIQGIGQQTVVVRARGPSLAEHNISNFLPNPKLIVVRSLDQAIIASNDDWGSASNVAAITSSGFAPANSTEAAALLTLDPGAYTVIASDTLGRSGIGIVEVFAVPPRGLSQDITFRPGVLPLAPAQVQNLISASDSELVFNGLASFTAGQIFIVNGRAYKVESLTSTGSTTTVRVSIPRIEEVFSSIRIKGEIDDELLREASFELAPDVKGEVGRNSKGLTISAFSFDVGQPDAAGVKPVTVSGSMEFNLTKKFIDIDWGSLTVANYDIEFEQKGELKVSAKREVEYELETPKLLGQYTSLPILQSLGALQFHFPVYVSVEGKVGVRAEIAFQGTRANRVRGGYRASTGHTLVSSTRHAEATSLEVPAASLSTGVEAYLSVFPHLNPQFSIILSGSRQIPGVTTIPALLTLEGKVGIDLAGAVRMPTPPNTRYCYKYGAYLKAAAAVELAGLPKYEFAEYSTPIISTEYPVGVGCEGAATSVTSLSLSPSSVREGEFVTFNVSVRVSSNPLLVASGPFQIVDAADRVVCGAQLISGDGQCGSTFTAGTYAFRAKYPGSLSIEASVSPAQTLVVTTPQVVPYSASMRALLLNTCIPRQYGGSLTLHGAPVTWTACPEEYIPAVKFTCEACQGVAFSIRRYACTMSGESFLQPLSVGSLVVEDRAQWSRGGFSGDEIRLPEPRFGVTLYRLLSGTYGPINMNGQIQDYARRVVWTCDLTVQQHANGSLIGGEFQVNVSAEASAFN